ncbi:unnamed protein product [Vicia faba]|uniref:Endonuclease/exonuclease/phosphatase domain-containing protein n=1 Tax=Vicia faba TaxID=3906 RepID=A0AAV0ZX45_VICFA|nr:unnamed protein product [Vicia faba]
MDIGTFNIRGLSGSSDCEWSAKESEVRSGGIITTWKKGIIELVFSFMGKGYLGMKEMWKGTNIYFINIYSPCTLNEKRVSWMKLLNLRNKYTHGEWVLWGYFNASKSLEERWGRSGDIRTLEMEDFCSFIDLMELIDVPMLENKHTLINSNGSTSSMLDRFLMSEGLIQKWNIAARTSGNRDISDHRPVWILSTNLNWGPKPFKVFRTWYDHPEFMAFGKKE